MRTLKKFVRDLLWMPGRDLHDPQRGWKLPDGVSNGFPPVFNQVVQGVVALYLIGVLTYLAYALLVGL